MVILDAGSRPATMTDVLLKMFIEEARWLDKFIEKKKEELGDAFPAFLLEGRWEGEHVFNKRLNAYRRLQHAFWERVHTDPAASQSTVGLQILPSASDIDLNNFYKELKRILDTEQKPQEVPPFEEERRKAA